MESSNPQGYSPEFWKDATVFVTGGTGFVGGVLLKDLLAQGCKVKALVRSEKVAKDIEQLGIVVVLGDVNDEEAWKKGCENTKVVFHLAAKVDIEGKLADFIKINVEGTELGLKTAKAAKVKKFVLCSSEAVLIGGPKLVNADETWPYPQYPMGPYPTTKGLQERTVIAANDTQNDFQTVVIRPRLIWGKGDTVILPKIGEAVASGQWKWLGGGGHLTSATNVYNVAEGLMKGAEKGKGGEIYFVTDGKPVVMKEFLGNYLEMGGYPALKSGSIPLWLAKGLGKIGIVPASFPYLMGEECTINDAKARKEIGYMSYKSQEQGLKEFKEWVEILSKK